LIGGPLRAAAARPRDRDRTRRSPRGSPAFRRGTNRPAIEPRPPGVERLVHHLVGCAEDRALRASDRGSRSRAHDHRRDEVSVRVPVVDRISPGVPVLVLASFEAARVAARERSGLWVVLARSKVHEARVRVV
jgi:hypothetical protein